MQPLAKITARLKRIFECFALEVDAFAKGDFDIAQPAGIGKPAFYDPRHTSGEYPRDQLAASGCGFDDEVCTCFGCSGGAFECLACIQLIARLCERRDEPFAELDASTDWVFAQRIAQRNRAVDAPVSALGLCLERGAECREVQELAACISDKLSCILGLIEKPRARALDRAACNLTDLGDRADQFRRATNQRTVRRVNFS